MKLELNDRKVVITGGMRDVGRTISEALAGGRADVVIWIRDWSDEVNEQAPPTPGADSASALLHPNDNGSHNSLWRETMGY